MKRQDKVFIAVSIGAVFFWAFVAVCFADDVTNFPKEVQCIVGEASGEDWLGQVAIGEAIRNRGHLRGVYGCDAKRVHTEPMWVWKKAEMAWYKSAETNLTKGADHWHSVKEKPAWWEKYGELTTTIGSHKFYKDVKR